MNVVCGLITSVIGWGLVMHFAGPEPYSLFGFIIIPNVGMIGSALYLFVPGLFHVGPAAENASIVSYVAAAVLLSTYIAIPLLLTQTVVTAAVSSFFLGAMFQYLGRAVIEARGNKIVGRS